ncbi:MAG: hypothetical protein HC933_05100 [Pleurocapsa sp. SU_196_0]|nr:hypothetical protein [Pleurocapsa sp. SU_196_0]
MPSLQKAKSEVVSSIVRLVKKERLSYDEFTYVCQQVRRKLGLKNRSGFALCRTS